MNPLQALNEHGQAVWLDFLARDFLRKGGLRQLIAEDGLSGVTSNPSIFEKAIGESSEYEDKLRAAAASGGETISSIYESLAIEDIRARRR